MSEPPEGEEKAPKGARTLRGAKQNSVRENEGKVGMFPLLVKSVLERWPLWLGSTWLKDHRRSAP